MKTKYNGKSIFKIFLQQIIDAENKEDAIQNVFYGTVWNEKGEIEKYGIDIAFQHNKITWEEHEMLLALIEKMA